MRMAAPSRPRLCGDATGRCGVWGGDVVHVSGCRLSLSGCVSCPAPSGLVSMVVCLWLYGATWNTLITRGCGRQKGGWVAEEARATASPHVCAQASHRRSPAHTHNNKHPHSTLTARHHTSATAPRPAHPPQPPLSRSSAVGPAERTQRTSPVQHRQSSWIRLNDVRGAQVSHWSSCFPFLCSEVWTRWPRNGTQHNLLTPAAVLLHCSPPPTTSAAAHAAVAHPCTSTSTTTSSTQPAAMQPAGCSQAART